MPRCRSFQLNRPSPIVTTNRSADCKKILPKAQDGSVSQAGENTPFWNVEIQIESSRFTDFCRLDTSRRTRRVAGASLLKGHVDEIEVIDYRCDDNELQTRPVTMMEPSILTSQCQAVKSKQQESDPPTVDAILRADIENVDSSAPLFNTRGSGSEADGLDDHPELADLTTTLPAPIHIITFSKDAVEVRLDSRSGGDRSLIRSPTFIDIVTVSDGVIFSTAKGKTRAVIQPFEHKHDEAPGDSASSLSVPILVDKCFSVWSLYPKHDTTLHNRNRTGTSRNERVAYPACKSKDDIFSKMDGDIATRFSSWRSHDGHSAQQGTFRGDRSQFQFIRRRIFVAQ